MIKLSDLLCGFLAVAVVGSVMLGSALAGQFTTAETFDTNRLYEIGRDRYVPFDVTGTQPLRDLLEANAVRADTRILVTQTAAGSLALLTDEMSYHHIAQGNANGQDWMVTF